MSRLLTVPAQQFPSMGSQQRVSSLTESSKVRNKVQLKPGRSLMDWVRLSKTSKDLAGVGRHAAKTISQEELSVHNSVDDAWTVIRGKVYNVTPYMEYHPGGADELLRAAGKDGTQLFDEIHRWVNVESMLEKCFIGKLNTSPSHVFKKPASPNLLKPEFAIPAIPKLLDIPKTIRHDWFQTDSTVTIAVYTKCKELKHESVIVDMSNKLFTIMVYVDDMVYYIHYELTADVSGDYTVKVSKDSGKLEITLVKLVQEQWSKLGVALKKNDHIYPMKTLDVKYRCCSLVDRSNITHDTAMYTFELPVGTRMCVPTGCHVHVKASVQGMELARSYTPVLHSLLKADPLKSRLIHLMIKTYSNGALTPVVQQLNIGDTISISNYEGTFTESLIKKYSHLVLLAAGTGFTPMVKLIYKSITDTGLRNQVKLIFFNKTEKDILWKDQLDELLLNKRFSLEYILSEPSESWTGRKGRISKELLIQLQAGIGRDVLFCICGPLPFTEVTVRFLKELEFTEDQVFAFCG